MTQESAANDPVTDRPPEADAPADPVLPAGSPTGWTPARTQPDWVGPPPPVAAVRTPGRIIAAVQTLVVGVGLLIWGIPAVILHVQAASGMLGEMPSTHGFVRTAAAFLGFFLTFVGAGALTNVQRNQR